MLFFQQSGDLGSPAVKLELVQAFPARSNCFVDAIPKFVIELKVRVDALHGKVYVAEMIFEELFIFFVGYVLSNFFTEVVEVPLPDIQSCNDFFFEGFEFFQLMDQGLTRFFVHFLKFHPFAHQFVHFFVEQADFDDVIFMVKMP